MSFQPFIQDCLRSVQPGSLLASMYPLIFCTTFPISVTDTPIFFGGILLRCNLLATPGQQGMKMKEQKSDTEDSRKSGAKPYVSISCFRWNCHFRESPWVTATGAGRLGFEIASIYHPDIILTSLSLSVCPCHHASRCRCSPPSIRPRIPASHPSRHRTRCSDEPRTSLDYRRAHRGLVYRRLQARREPGSDRLAFERCGEMARA